VGAGVRLLPMTAMLIVGAPLAGAVIGKAGPRIPIVAGMHAAFLVAAAAALAGALIGLLIRPGRVGAEGVHAGL
jgi:hypothetical protein